MLNSINIGVIGCGYWGPNLIRNFRSLPECRVMRVCDVEQDRLAHMKKLYPSRPLRIQRPWGKLKVEKIVFSCDHYAAG